MDSYRLYLDFNVPYNLGDDYTFLGHLDLNVSVAGQFFETQKNSQYYFPNMALRINNGCFGILDVISFIVNIVKAKSIYDLRGFNAG